MTTLLLFRVFFADGATIDERAETSGDATASAIARKTREAERANPGKDIVLPRVTKTKLVRGI